VRCPRCGNENLDQNRFCGMCGASLLSSTEPVSVTAPVPSASQSAAAPAPAETSRPSPPDSDTSPSISGPSFLGLNDRGRSAPRKRASLSIDPDSAPGSNLEYLLDEEEPQHHWGIGKILLILIALALAVGFGYLRFKNQGLAWLNGLKKPTAAVAQNSSTPDTTNAPAASPSITPDSQPPVQPLASAPQPATGNPGNAPSGNAPTTAPAATTAPTSATSTPATSTPPEAPKSTDMTAATEADKALTSDKAVPTPAKDSTATPDKDSAAANDTESDTTAAASKPAEKPKPEPKAPAPKPSAATKAASSYDAVAEARKYLYGRGAPQDCDRGMRLLKPEANKSNPKAMIEMGALYSAGLCAPRDLPTAYRWFAIALRKDPGNTSVQADLTKLWGEMTQPERQLAIKLTQ